MDQVVYFGDDDVKLRGLNGANLAVYKQQDWVDLLKSIPDDGITLNQANGDCDALASELDNRFFPSEGDIDEVRPILVISESAINASDGFFGKGETSKFLTACAKVWKTMDVYCFNANNKLRPYLRYKTWGRSATLT